MPRKALATCALPLAPDYQSTTQQVGRISAPTRTIGEVFEFIDDRWHGGGSP